MIAQAKQFHRRRTPRWHAAFLAMVPAITRYARICFRAHDPEPRDDLTQEVIANCLVAFARLVELGKQDIAYPVVLARYAVAQIRDGRRVGTSLNVKDVSSAYCQMRKRFSMKRLDRYDAEDGSWQEVLVEDKRSGPSDIAAARIDFAAWLSSLDRRGRRIAEELATGESTGAVARRFRVSPLRVSQLRRELKASWEEFHEKTADAELQPA